MERLCAPGLASRLFGGDRARTLALLQATWPYAVGPELARRTEVLALEGDTLRVGVPDASWRKGLLKMRGPILGRLARLTGDLAPRRMSFSEGTRPRPLEPEKTRASPPQAPLSPAVTLAASRITDPEARRRFLDSVARYLSRFSKETPCAKP